MKSNPSLSALFATLALACSVSTSTAVDLDLKRITPVPATEKIPVQDFFRAPFMRDPVLNLSGTHIVALVSAGEDRTNYMTFELKTKTIEYWGPRGDSDVNWVMWLDSERLLFGVGAMKGGAYVAGMADVGKLGHPSPLFQNVGSSLIAVPPGDRRHPLMHLNANGSMTGKYGEVVIADANYVRGSLLDYHSDNLEGVDENNQRHVAKRLPILETPGGFDLYYLATRDGALQFGVTSTDGVMTLNHLEGGNWQKSPMDLDETPIYGSGDNPGEIVALAARANGQPRPLQLFDVRSGKPGEVLLADPAYDFNGWLYRDAATHNIVGAFYDRAAPTVQWFSEGYRLLQKAIDQAFPGQIARIIGTDEGGKIVLVNTFSDRQPPTYRWVNLAEKTAGDIQKSRPWIDPARMLPMSVIKYKTHDGKKLDAYVTMPAGATKQNPPPLVVIAGGNGSRASWGYDDKVQFYASRGYAVLQPNHRGSAGYGWMFTSEDEWDYRKMHDDTTAAVKALIASGLVDAKRVAIVGSGFGGFLALEGVAYEPDLYKAAIAIGPVCDWTRYVQDDKTNKFRSPWYSRVVRKLGDPAKQPEKFAAISPLSRAGSVKAAVLLAYGEYEESVSISMDKDFVSAVKRNGVPAETMYFLTEGGEIRHLDHLVELYTRVESFLAENLK